MSNDLKCVCEGNWRSIIHESEPFLDKVYIKDGKECVFCGIMHCSDDYYYCMSCDGDFTFLSCVGNLESYDYILVE